MERFKEGVRDLGDEPARQTEGAQQQAKSGMESAKEKNQGESNPMEKAKSAVEDKIQGLREEGQKFMGSGGDKGGSGR